MAEAMKKADDAPRTSDEARRETAQYQRQQPAKTETHGMESEPTHTSLAQDIHARVLHQHKGDVGRPGTNEEVFQGSKQKALP